jgi:hypothetical protein
MKNFEDVIDLLLALRVFLFVMAVIFFALALFDK